MEICPPSVFTLGTQNLWQGRLPPYVAPSRKGRQIWESQLVTEDWITHAQGLEFGGPLRDLVGLVIRKELDAGDLPHSHCDGADFLDLSL